MLNPNEWSKGSHFIRCYLKPKVSMAETQVIEAPWLHYKPAWPNLQELTHHWWWSSPLPLFLFSVYFFVYGWKSSTFVWLVVGLRIWYFVWGFEKWRFLFWAWIFFSKLIYLWVLGRPKKMGFDLDLSAVICMYVNLSMCVQLFLKREICILIWFCGDWVSEKWEEQRKRRKEWERYLSLLRKERGVRWWGFEEREIWC